MEAVFLEFSARKLRQLESRISACLTKLTDEQVWIRPGAEQNAIGNLVLHLCGNVRQWIGMGVLGEVDHRQRDAEFAALGGVSANDLRDRLSNVVTRYSRAIELLDGGMLLQTTSVQNYNVTKLEAIYHVVEHFAQHTGQILLLTKAITASDLGFYRHLDDSHHGQSTP